MRDKGLTLESLQGFQYSSNLTLENTMTDKTTSMPAPQIVSLDDCCAGGSCAGEPIVKPEPVIAAAKDDCCGGGSCAGGPIVEPEPVVAAAKDDCCAGGSCAGGPIVKPEPVVAAAKDDCCAGGSCAGPVIEQAPASASAQQPGLWSRLMAAIMPGRSA